ncbi:MAG: hypothetical protein KC766_24660 [Myxococcales bacterium]|nr:hypothetical protein [Myxococcales bacterium]
MIGRFLLGLIKGVVVGAVVAVVLVKGLGIVTWGAVVAYVAAVVTGLLTALVSGKAIWVRDAGVENAIKAVAGVLIAVVGMYGVRRWLPYSVDLSLLQAGSGRLGDLPAAALPLVGTLLALMFEIDNTGESAKEAGRAQSKQRIAESKRVEELDVAESELATHSSPRRRARH